MNETIEIGDMIEVTAIGKADYPFFRVGDKGKVFLIDQGVFCDFNQPGQVAVGDGFWWVGPQEGASEYKKI